MSLSQKPRPLTISNQMSMRVDPLTRFSYPEACLWEDGCTVRRPPLQLTHPSLWCVGGLLAAATAWIMT